MLSRGKASEVGIERKKLLAELLLQSNRIETYPASLAQQRLWFLDQLETKSAAYNVHLGLWLCGRLDMGALRASLQEIVNRHDSLRTSFRLEGSALVQIVMQGLSVDIPITEVAGTGNLYPETYAIAKAEVETTFDLQNAPLFRARILRVTAEDHVFLCTLHHIVTDSWSMQILAKELATLYSAFSNGTPSPLPELPIGYGDFSEWQRKWLTTDRVQQQLMFWKHELEEAPAVLELRMQRPRAPEQTFAGGSQTVPISDETSSAIRSLALDLQATPFMILLAAFKVLLYRASGQPDILVGVPVAGREPVETEGLIGFFVKTLVLRDNLFGNRPFTDLIAQVRETTLRAFANADVPFENVVEALQPERNLSYNPIFQVMFSVIKSAVQSHRFGKLTAYPYVVTPSTSIFDLSMTIIEGVTGQWWVQLDYNTDLFDSQDISGMLADYTALLQAIATSPERRILDFSFANTVSGPSPEPSLSRPIKSKREPVMSASPILLGQLTEPIDREEELLLGIWKNLLRLPEVGIDDNFFDVGGHSLLAAQLVAQVQNATGRKVVVSAVFRAPTIRAFAELLRGDSFAKSDPIVMRLSEGSSAISFFAVAAPQVDTFGFAQLARYLPSNQSIYKLQMSAPVVPGRPFNREQIQTLGKTYIANMKDVQPTGPYCLGAMCGGVVIAQEMIRQLESEGEEVGLFAIFDTWVLENSQIRPLWAIDYYLQRFRIFRALPVNEQLATIRRFLKLRRTPDNADSQAGWKAVYWPGKDFQPPQFRAPVLLFKRPKQPYFYVKDPKMGWGFRSLGGVEICEIDCGHVELLREPYVRLVSETIGKHLQTIRQESSQVQSSASKVDLRSDLDSGTCVNSVA